MSDKIERPYGLRGDNSPPVSDENPLAERLGAYLGEQLQALIVRGAEHMGTAIIESLREASSANRSASYNKKESTPSEATKLEYQLQIPEPTKLEYQQIPEVTKRRYQQRPKEQLHGK